MMDVLRQKLLRLVRDEDGVALVVTLALFMFLYVSCAGVFAVGRTVKNRVRLQNAADAAASSAAVVEADVLSRVAELNRETARVYQDLIRRQRDYVVLTWLQKAYDAYKTDRARYEVFGDAAGTLVNQMDLNGTKKSAAEIEDLLSGMEELEAGIEADSARLQALREDAEELFGRKGLRESLRSKVEGAASFACEENLLSRLGRDSLFKTVFATDWLKSAPNDAAFLADALADETGALDFPAEVWFQPIASDDAIGRHYVPDADGNVARWWYRVSPASPVVPQTPVRSADLGKDERPLVAFDPDDERFTAPRSFLLAEDYFPSVDEDTGEIIPGKGAVTVCVAHRTDNPWRFGDATALDGLYDVFKPVSEHARWARAVSSAQAGYADEDEAAGVYSLKWKDETGREIGRKAIFTNDWDAVYLPVRGALTAADFEELVGKADGWGGVLASDDEAEELIRCYERGLENGTALPLMHNDAGAKRKIEWSDDGVYSFLDLMFH